MSILDRLIGLKLDDKYLIEKKLGQGGMGAVFRAKHLGTKRPVAIKVISPDFMTNSEFIDRFKREAEAAGLLRHPNVVDVTDFGFSRVGDIEVAYLVMEYLVGSNLGDLMRRRASLPLTFVVDIVEQICLAIDCAHKQGIVHRDLKPDNIWLEPNGRGGYNVKVLDFGLAKLRPTASVVETDVASSPPTATAPEISAIKTFIKTPAGNTYPSGVSTKEQEQNSEEAATRINNPNNTPLQLSHVTSSGLGVLNTEELTQAGAILGTPLYMSPEQCKGEPPDARSDIYSLGVMVYFMFTGETPFTGPPFQLMLHHVETPPPRVKDRCPLIPSAVSQLIESAMAKSPDDRPASAISFATALHATSEGEVPIIRQALQIYSSHFFAILRLSLSVFLPFILLNLVLLIAVAQAPFRSLPSPLVDLIHIGHWLFSLLLILFANSASTAAFTKIVEHLHVTPTKPIKIVKVLKAVQSRLGVLLISSIIGFAAVIGGLFKLFRPGARAFVDQALMPAVVMMEGGSASNVRARARQLTDRLRTLVMRLRMRDFFIAVMTLLGYLQVFVVYGLIVDVLNPVPVSRAPLLLILTLIPPAILVLLHPPLALAQAILYLKTRMVGNEQLSEELSHDIETIDLPTRRLSSNLRAVTLLAIASMLLISWIAVNGSVLKRAAEKNYYNCVGALITSGANVNFKDTTGKTPLMEAAADGHIETVKALIKAGALINERDDSNWTSLIYAADNGHTEVVKILLAAGADIEARHNYGSTSIIRAARHGYRDTVAVLLAAGANVNHQNNLGLSALMEAITDRGDSDTIRTLIDAGADVNAVTRNGDTVIKLARRKGDETVVNLLKQAGARE